MTATFTAQPRHGEVSSQKPPRDIPVLFHLMDVSWPKEMGQAPARFRIHSPEPEENCEPETEVEALAESLAVATPPSSETAVESTTVEEHRQEYSVPSTPYSVPEAAAEAEASPAATEPADRATEPTDSAPPAAPEATAPAEATEPTDSTPAVADAEVGDTSAAPPTPADEPTVSPRERAEQRRRQRPGIAHSNWFSVQGKYIAIGFVLALVATVYAARTSKKPVHPTAAGHAHHADATHKHGASTAEIVIEMPAKSGQAATSPASSIAAAAASKTEAKEPQVDLHPPAVPQLAESKPATPGADANLFPWGKPEERVAARPQPPQLTPQPGITNPYGPSLSDPSGPAPAGPAQAPQANPAYSGAPAPGPTLQPAVPVMAEQPQYPSTGYPATSYRSEFQPVPPGGPAAGPAGPPAGNQPYYPTTAGGYRYERTGSGLY